MEIPQGFRQYLNIYKTSLITRETSPYGIKMYFKQIKILHYNFEFEY